MGTEAGELVLAAVHYSVKNVRTAFSLLLLAADGAAHFNIATADGAGNKTFLASLHLREEVV